MQEGQLRMTQADRDRLVTLRKAKKRLITQREAAAELELSVRQVKRLLYELGICWIAAHSPQAKGRGERNFGTAQDRLGKGMRVAGVRAIEQANASLTTHY